MAWLLLFLLFLRTCTAGAEALSSSAPLGGPGGGGGGLGFSGFHYSADSNGKSGLLSGASGANASGAHHPAGRSSRHHRREEVRFVFFKVASSSVSFCRRRLFMSDTDLSTSLERGVCDCAEDTRIHVRKRVWMYRWM